MSDKELSQVVAEQKGKSQATMSITTAIVVPLVSLLLGGGGTWLLKVNDSIEKVPSTYATKEEVKLISDRQFAFKDVFATKQELQQSFQLIMEQRKQDRDDFMNALGRIQDDIAVIRKNTVDNKS